MTRTRYVDIVRRRREGKTDYGKRKVIIQSRRTMLNIRISNKTTQIQFITPKIGGDVVNSSANSSQLTKLGWNGSGKSIPGVYLTGYLAGKKAIVQGIKDAVPYIGIRRFQFGSKISACIKGVLDAGVRVPFDSDIIPTEERLKGKHISEYAASLERETVILQKQKRSGFDHSKYLDNIEKVKSSIDAGYQN